MPDRLTDTPKEGARMTDPEQPDVFQKIAAAFGLIAGIAALVLAVILAYFGDV